MPSIIRRGGAHILRLLESGADPAAVANAVEVYSKEDAGITQLFARASDGTITQLTPGGSSSTAAPTIWDVPSVPDALDDEFNVGNSLDAAWAVSEGSLDATAIDPYAAVAGDSRISVNTRRPSWAQFQPISGAVAISKAFVPGAGDDYAVWFRGGFNHRLTAAANNDFDIAMLLTTEPYSSDGVFVYLNEADASSIQMKFLSVVGGVTTTVGVTTSIAPGSHQTFQGGLIQCFGATNTYHGWALTDREAIYMGSVVNATVIGRAGLRFLNAATTSPGNMIVGADFIRFVRPSTTFLP